MLNTLIVGGGLAGWCLFEHLKELGVPLDQLGLIEKGISARGASGVLRGMLHPFTGRTLYPKPGSMPAWSYSGTWLQKMQNEAREWGADTPFYREHALWRVSLNTEVQTRFERSFQRATETLPGYSVQRLKSTKPLQNVIAGYVFPNAASVETQRLLAYFQQRYAMVCSLHQNSLDIQRKKDHWQVTTGQRIFKTRHLVLAPGNELNSFFPELPLRTKRGEVIFFESAEYIPHCVSGGGRYIIPLGQKGNNYMYAVGATFYRDEALWPLDTSWRDMCDRLHWFPNLEQARPFRVWSGVRATLYPDRQPLCGPVPGYESLWLMGAFSTSGLLQIPRHAQALAHVLLNKNAVLPQESLPERVLSFKSSLGSQRKSHPQGVFTLLNRVGLGNS